MSIITDIRESRGLVEITVDCQLLARVRRAHFSKCQATVGEDIDPEAYLGRLASAQFSDCYEAALSSLDYCARSAHELSNTLSRKGYVEPAVEAVVARLTESGLIDDARYARRMAEVQSGKPVGLYAFKRKLRAKGISEDDAEEALSAFDDEQQRAAALEAAQKLFKKYEALPEREARAKLSQALMRRGFPWEAVESAVEALLG